jgi:membrane fusion protein, multidrug efflux system
MQINGRAKRIAAGGVLAGLMILGGCDRQSAKSGPSQGGPPEVAVVMIQPQRRMLTTELTGRTAAHRIAEVRPQVGGIVQKRLFVEGKEVKEGEPLYLIDPVSYKTALDNAEANLSAVQRNAERARAVLAASMAGDLRQRATLDLARMNRERYVEAFKERAVAAGQRDQAVTEADVAAATLQAAEAQVESDRKAVSVAEASIQQAEAALKMARINLGYTTVTAPISGRTGRSAVTEGALVAAYQPVPLASVQQLDPMYVDVTQSTTDLLNLRRGLDEGRLDQGGASQKKVRLVLTDGTTYPLEGTLQFRDVTVDPTTGSVILRAVFPNPKGVLLPGMFVRAVIEEGVNPRALLVPQQAVSRTPKGDPLALIVDAEGKVQQRMLTLDRAIGDQWLVTHGLAAGDRVIVEGGLKVRPGLSVKAVPFTPGGEKKDGAVRKASPGPAKRMDGGA